MTQKPQNDDRSDGPLESDMEETTELSGFAMPTPQRERLPDDRPSVVKKFSVGDQKGYLIVGLYKDGRPGELFIKASKQGSTLSGLLNTIGILTSLCLQYGVPVDALARKLEYIRFEPSGWTMDEDIRQAHSITDFIFRWLGIHFSDTYRKEHNTIHSGDEEQHDE